MNFPMYAGDAIVPPQFRAVDQHTGDVATPTSLPAAYQIIDGLVSERDRALKRAEDARDELDNMVNLTKQVGQLGNYLEHALADRDQAREDRDIVEHKLDAALCEVNELKAENRDLAAELAAVRAERDTAKAVKS